MANVKIKTENRFAHVADAERIERAVMELRKNGITAEIVQNAEMARQRMLELLPVKAEVMNMTSLTLATIGITVESLEANGYRTVRSEFKKLNSEEDALMRQRLGAAPEWAIGSVHAVTESGQVMVASNTGSQMGAYVYGAPHVIWVVGGQKVVKDIDEGFKRIYEYCLPLENDRAKHVYGQGSNVSKLLIVNKEVKPDRIFMILVNERLGF